MEKIVCYFMTRNIYTKVLPSLKSLIRNGNVDKVYLLIEDDEIGFWLPEMVETFNISGWKEKLDPNGPNYGCRWSYMVMMKVLLSRIFPQLNRVVSMDVDTIIKEDISGLWDIQMDDYYIAGAREWYWSRKYNRDCVNGGVLLWNLDKMRDGMTDKVLLALNTRKFTFAEQDALSEVCHPYIKIIDSAYNNTEWTDPPQSNVRIVHFAAYREKFFEQEVVKEYMSMEWSKIINPSAGNAT